VGREAGALLRLLLKTTHPQPLPVKEGALPTPRPPVGGSEESKQKVDQVQARTQGPGGSAF